MKLESPLNTYNGVSENDPFTFTPNFMSRVEANEIREPQHRIGTIARPVSSEEQLFALAGIARFLGAGPHPRSIFIRAGLGVKANQASESSPLHSLASFVKEQILVPGAPCFELSVTPLSSPRAWLEAEAEALADVEALLSVPFDAACPRPRPFVGPRNAMIDAVAKELATRFDLAGLLDVETRVASAVCAEGREALRRAIDALVATEACRAILCRAAEDVQLSTPTRTAALGHLAENKTPDTATVAAVLGLTSDVDPHVRDAARRAIGSWLAFALDLKKEIKKKTQR